MSCCGQARAKIASEEQKSSRKPVSGAVTFEYTGPTSLTIVGPYTRTQYHFPCSGARVPVNGRDSVAFAAVRALRRV
jgi:hypothetical protein